ncbi:MAG: CpsD/CapB family tyrosine-protein kinase [Paracoccaceae bacterium]
MEKIQEALAKARAARGEVSAAVPRPEVQTTLEALRVSPEVAADTAWSTLSPLSPDGDALKKARVMTLTGGQDAAPFDVMRTKVLQTMRANNWRRLAITSPTPACGKSTITLNLGFSFARQPDIRTIVAELDLRCPSLAKTLGHTPVRSFAEVLQGKADFAENAVCFNHNLAFATNAVAMRNPAELLHGAGVQGILAAIEARYAPDLMIFDMPPILVSDDAMAFAGQVDCVLLVAAAEATTVKEIDTCERELATQTNVMGVVLNKCRFMGKEYGYSYYN